MKRWLAALTRRLGPAWLAQDELYVDGEYIETDSILLFTTEMLLDSRLERLRTGVLCRFPGNGTMPADALQYAGRDRRIRRGPAEPQEVYEPRLVTAIEKHRTRGNAFRLMEQVRANCYPHDVRVRVWTDRGDVYTLERDGTTHSVVRDTAWNWDGLFGTGTPPVWSRFWVLIYVTVPTATGAPTQPWQRLTWGMPGLTWGSGYTWGSTATPADVQAIRSIVETWKPEGTHCRYIAVVFDDAAFDPAGALPDGTWGPWTKTSGTVHVETRSKAAIYWPGTRGAQAA